MPDENGIKYHLFGWAMTTVCPGCGKGVSDEKTQGTCRICGHEKEVHPCDDGKCICDACLDDMVFEEIIGYCLASESSDPYEIFKGIIDMDQVRMHDYKHHVIVGSALLTAHRNSGFQCDLESMLREMLKRGRKVPPGSCGFMGNCGAAVSVGTFLSILTGTTPYSEDTWGDVNLATAQAQIQMALIGGPRCCKRNSMIALKVGAQIAADKFGSRMEIASEMKCGMSERNRECIKERCPFYQGQ